MQNVRGFPGISADFHVGRLVRGTFAGESPHPGVGRDWSPAR